MQLRLWGFDKLMGKNKKRGTDVKSKDTSNRVEVIKRVNLGHIPLFLQLAHKGLEKANPAGEAEAGGVRFNVPKDLLQVSVGDPKIFDSVERIDVIYFKSTT